MYTPIQEFFIRDGVPNAEVHLSAYFNVFIFMIIFNGFGVRSDKVNLFDHLRDNTKFLSIMGLIITLQIVFTYIGGDVLRTVGLTFTEWLVVFGLSLTIIPLGMIRKMMMK